MSHASGLAAAVRGATESDTFDLAGQNTTTIETNIKTAFQSPFPIKEMIRITFVTGAGKLGRQKYDENAAKTITSALRDLNFEEDRGASCIPECAGTFKLQHDTGKNLKTVVVFPRISEEISNAEGGGTTSNNDTSSSGFLPKGSPEEMIALSSNTVFANMVKSQCPSWTQKKGCTQAISSIKSQVEELDEKLLTGTPLTDAEQEFYDAVSSTALEEKLELVKDMMHKQVDDGSITQKEKTQLLQQVSERLDKVNSEISDAESNGQKKKVEKLRGVKEKVTTRKTKLSTIKPSKPHPLKHEKEITALRVELLPMQDLQEGSKGKLLTLKETQMLARKEEIMEEILDLQVKSRGWFESDEDFDARIEASEAAWRVQNKGNSKAKKSSSSAPKGGGGGGGNAWSTTTASKGRSTTKTSTAWKKTSSTQQRKPTTRGGGVFAAMMGDSDSD